MRRLFETREQLDSRLRQKPDANAWWLRKQQLAISRRWQMLGSVARHLPGEMYARRALDVRWFT